MNKKDIDKLFQDKLGDFHEIPDEKVWKSIEQSLDQRKKSRRIIPIWWKLGGVAALLMLALLVWNPFSSPEPVSPTITDIEKTMPENPSPKKGKSKPELEIPASEISFTDENAVPSTETKRTQNESVTNNVKVASGDASKSTTRPSVSASEELGGLNDPVVDNTTTTEFVDTGKADDRSEKEVTQAEPTQELFEEITDRNNAVADRETEPTEAEKNPAAMATQTEIAEQVMDKEIPEESGKKSIFDEINQEEDPLVESSGPKWSVGPSIAPVYFNSFGDGSPIHSNFASNSKSGNVNLSYGVAVSYDVSKKLSLRSGVHKVDYGYNTNDITFSSSLVASTSAEITNINYNSNSRNLVVESNSARTPAQDFALNDIVAQSPSRNGRMVQEIGYLEVPLELNYALLDRKLGINLIGGFSSLFLVNNAVTLESSGSSTEMGEANNLNDLNFSTNVGLGINYRLNDKMKVHLEPMFKYQMNMFSEVEGDFQPYSLGVYTGMSFKF